MAKKNNNMLLIAAGLGLLYFATKKKEPVRDMIPDGNTGEQVKDQAFDDTDHMAVTPPVEQIVTTGISDMAQQIADKLFNKNCFVNQPVFVNDGSNLYSKEQMFVKDPLYVKEQLVMNE